MGVVVFGTSKEMSLQLSARLAKTPIDIAEVAVEPELVSVTFTVNV
jgi:hypothetical protein